ncbi:MAG: DUF4388 domain-containing protein [Kofleriaceae bacterium]|nr:DUF4388 domain-containing protein [Kofleriaceae bacterium]
MSVRGALSTMPAEDVLDWAVKRGLSGPITFERRGVVRSVIVDGGAIILASSNRREEQLGVILVRSGLVPDRALADALETRAETGVPLGKVLLMSGLIKEDELSGILATKIRETVTDVVTWTDGTFDIIPRMAPAAIGVAAHLPIEICLTVARRRMARMTEIMGLLGSDEAMFYAPPAAAPPPPAEDEVGKMWSLAVDRRTGADIVAAFAGERFTVYDELAKMVAREQLVIDRRHRGERTNSAAELAAGARSRLRQGDRAGAFAMASQALQQDPGNAEVRQTYTSIQRARVAEVARQLLARHCVPKRVKDVAPTQAAELGLSAAEVELAARVDGRWDLLSLIRSAPVREGEALLAFAHLAEVGVVELA